jgi:hypothetical protein
MLSQQPHAPGSLCGSEVHSTLISRAGFAAHLTRSLERYSTPTLPRHCLVGFADYKQKDGGVNKKSNLCRIVSTKVGAHTVMQDPFSHAKIKITETTGEGNVG